MRRSLVLLLLLLSSGTALAAENEAALVASVEGTVKLRGGTPVATGDRLAIPVEVDATEGVLSLVWEKGGQRLLVERVSVKLAHATSRGVRLVTGGTRVDLPPSQGLFARHQPEKSPKTFLRAAQENSGALTLASCQTLVRLLPAAAVSLMLDREGMQVVVQSEGGVVEILGRAGSESIVAGQRVTDACVPPPGEASIEPPETRSALTPFTP